MTRTLIVCAIIAGINPAELPAQTPALDNPQPQRIEAVSATPTYAGPTDTPVPSPAPSDENRPLTAGGVTILRHSSRPSPRRSTGTSHQAIGQQKPGRAVQSVGGALTAPTAASVDLAAPSTRGTLGVFTPMPADSRQPPSATESEVVGAAIGRTLDAATISNQIEQIKQMPAIDEDVRASQLKAYSEALEALAAATQLSAKTVKLREEIDLVPSRTAELKAASEEVLEPAEPRINTGTPLTEVDQLLAAQEGNLVEVQGELQAAEKAAIESERRSRALPGLIDQARQELADNAAEAAGEQAADGTTLSEAVIVRLSARKKMLEARIESMTVEQQSLTAGSEILSLKRELAAKKEKTTTESVKAWRVTVGAYRQSEANRKAKEARELLASAHPALLEAAERNAELAEERTQLTRKLEKLTSQQAVIDDFIATTDTAFEDVKAKYEAAGETTALGYLMRSYRSQLPSPDDLRQQQSESEAAMSDTQLQLLLLKDERDTLPAFEEQLDDLQSNLQSEIPSNQRHTFNETLATIRSDRREYLQALITDYETQLASLSNFNFATGRLLESRDSFAAFIGEHVLWIRSAAPLTSPQELTGATDAISYLLAPGNFASLVRQASATAKTRPFEAALLLVVFVAALSYGRRFRKRLIQSSRLSSAQESLKTAVFAVIFSLLAASVWPLLIGLAAWRIESLEQPTAWSMEFASALNSVAVLLLTASVIRQLCREQGVGELIFGWNRHVTRVIRQSTASAVLLGCPLAFGVKFLESHGDKVWIDSMGRILFIGGMVLLACIAHRVLHPSRGILATTHSGNPVGGSRRLPRVAYLFGMLCPAALGGLAAAGYFFTAEHLAERLVQTLWLATGTAVAVSVARRWLVVIAEELKRRLNRRSRQENLLTGGAANSEEPAAVETVSTDDHSDPKKQAAAESVQLANHVTFTPLAAEKPEDEESHSVQIKRQLSRLVSMTATVVFLVGCWSIWNSVLPALGILDRVEFGTTTVVAEKTVTAPDGSISIVESAEQQPVTLRHLLVCIGLIVVTCVAARNLPGLLEAVLFDRLPLDAGGRYAATTLSRYAVTTFGWVWALSTVGVTWSSIQWLVAAMTVGLGFGLQEIFGNLVSGLILLFERPVRVGDLVTVGGTTGTVTKMRIRATTITDPDRRELVVPNKKFITDEFVNWTLSDPITRVVFNVGVAYGSDTSQVHSLLMEIADKHPLVLDEPAPGALLTGFGDSTLDFELRIFIASRSSYVAVVHELNTSIEREFTRAGLEIAFPQRDLNIRSIEGLEHLLPLPKIAEKTRAA